MSTTLEPLPHLRFEIPEAARILRISRATLYERIRKGLITTQKDGRRTFITGASRRRLPYLLKKERGPGEHLGRDKVRRFFRELEAAGYVTRALWEPGATAAFKFCAIFPSRGAAL